MEERGSPGEFLGVDSTSPAWETEVTTANRSDNTGSRFCYHVHFTLHWLTLLFALIGLAGNATVLWLLGFRVHRNFFSVYILNLAGADFLFLCFLFIFSLRRIIWVSHTINLPIPKFFYIVYKFSYLAGLSLLSAISTERCLSVLWPIWYRCHRPRHTSAAVCGLLWTLSLVLCFLERGGCGLLGDYSFRSLSCWKFRLITAAWIIILFVVLCGSSLALLLRIFRGSRRMPVTRLYVTLVLTVLVFLLLGLPFGFHWILKKWIKTLSIKTGKTCNVYLVTLALSSANSCANPIIYFFVGSFRHRRFQRRTLRRILQRAMQDTPEEGEGGHRGSSGNSRELETVSSRC